MKATTLSNTDAPQRNSNASLAALQVPRADAPHEHPLRVAAKVRGLFQSPGSARALFQKRLTLNWLID